MDKCIWDTTNSIARKEKETKLNIPKLTTILSIKNFHHQQRTKKKEKKERPDYQSSPLYISIINYSIISCLFSSSSFSSICIIHQLIHCHSHHSLNFNFLSCVTFFFCFWTDFLVGISPIQFLNINTLYHHHIPTGSTFIVTY